MAWDPAEHVSSHNDLSFCNILFDGSRLWLVDWETAFRNDPFADLAVLADNLGTAPGVADALIHSWLGRPANADEMRRLAQMTVLTRLYYAGLMIASAGAPSARMTSLDAPTRAEFGALILRGALKIAAPEARRVRSKMYLADFLAGLDDALRQA
jgi:hypothetical protein